MKVVKEFCDDRHRYVTALKASGGNTSLDVPRWEGGAEARRQLAQLLGWKVVYEPSDIETDTDQHTESAS